MSSMTSNCSSHYASAKPGVACKYSMQIMELRDASLKYWSWTTLGRGRLGYKFFRVMSVVLNLLWYHRWLPSFVAAKENNKVSLCCVSSVGSFTTPFIFAFGRILPFIRLYLILFYSLIYLYILLCIFINYLLLLFLFSTFLRHWRTMCMGQPVPRTHCMAASPVLVYLPKSNLFLPFLVLLCQVTRVLRICLLPL